MGHVHTSAELKRSCEQAWVHTEQIGNNLNRHYNSVSHENRFGMMKLPGK